MFVCHWFESDKVTCGKDVIFVVLAELKAAIFSMCSGKSCIETYLTMSKAKAWTTNTDMYRNSVLSVKDLLFQI
jgi:hypothetical protein